MSAKKMLTNGVFCPMPWTGLMYNHDGTVKNCIRSSESIGDLKHHNIENIIASDKNIQHQNLILQDHSVNACEGCYHLEKHKNSFEIASDRIFYIRDLKHLPLDTYQLALHDLRAIDVRWSNVCNFACVYCSEEYSSKWAHELGVKTESPSESQIQQFKQYVFDHVAQLDHVYLAGGEPLLMKQNSELLRLLLDKNPDVHLRINTNLSRTETDIFDLICKFENVHWTVSVETMHHQFEYIRYGGNWQHFEQNLKIIQQIGHKISFNMLHFLLNSSSIFDTIDWLQDCGFHNNSFIAGPMERPVYLNVRHLPDHMLQSVQRELTKRIEKRPGYLLEDSYNNMLNYLQQPFEKDLNSSLQKLQTLDQRRNINSEEIFPELYSITHKGNNHGKTI
jgi:MoaA/NifB/PqqE/SkfB family radical SAM enzyme